MYSISFTVFITYNIIKIDDNNVNDKKTGEWWNRDPVQVIRQAARTGAAPNVSDAYTINGQPGDLYNCSQQGLCFYIL